jgi:hypothetical protein
MEFTKYIPLNFAIMANPFNWVNVLLMVLIGGLALHLILPPDAVTPSTTE